MTPHANNHPLPEFNPELNATTRKKLIRVPGTPVSEGKNTERSLRKLASEAFKFTCTQKKTTYKEVANKLIDQMSDEVGRSLVRAITR